MSHILTLPDRIVSVSGNHFSNSWRYKKMNWIGWYTIRKYSNKKRQKTAKNVNYQNWAVIFKMKYQLKKMEGSLYLCFLTDIFSSDQKIESILIVFRWIASHFC
jgi:hypothetical protein